LKQGLLPRDLRVIRLIRMVGVIVIVIEMEIEKEPW
jgi:hypothetical protein